MEEKMIGEDIRAAVFRDTKKFYAAFPPGVVSKRLIRFAVRNAGPRILDLGCATGNYCTALSQKGFSVTGADVNPEYVSIAKERGVDAVVVDGNVPFPDAAFDTVLMFEVLEHLPDPDLVVREARRLARRNVLFTTPNSGRMVELQKELLLLEHFADLDHRNFFTEESLDALLRPHFRRVRVRKDEGINPLALVGFWPIRMAGKALTRAHFIRPRFHFRLYAVAEV